MPEIDRDDFRKLLGTFATGVTVVTARDENGAPAGMTASAVTAVSLEPPLLLVCVDHTADFLAVLHRAPVFAVNILAADQESVSSRFAQKSGDKFTGVGYDLPDDGPPRLDGALAHITCTRFDTIEVGDHTVIVGTVTGGTAREGDPLLHFQGRYHTTK